MYLVYYWSITISFICNNELYILVTSISCSSWNTTKNICTSANPGR